MSFEQIAGDCALALCRRVDAQNVAESRNHVHCVYVAQLLNRPFVALFQTGAGEQEGAKGGGETIVGGDETAMVCAIDEWCANISSPFIPSHCV